MRQCQRTMTVQAKDMLMLGAVSSALRNIIETATSEELAVVGQDIALSSTRYSSYNTHLITGSTI